MTRHAGNAILAKNEYYLHHIARLPSGRAIAASYDIRIINVYAPSGTEKHGNRENF
jgi:exonuclease III